MTDATKISLICSMVVLLTALTPGARADQPYQLDNGLTVILRPVPGANQVAVVLLFNLGGDHDPVGRSGITHLLEHLYCTAGAGNRPASHLQLRLIRAIPLWGFCRAALMAPAPAATKR